MNTNQALEPKDEMSFVPFGAADRIKLNIQIIQNLVAKKTKQGHTCNKSDALRFMMLCQAQHLNPFAGDAYLVGYDSKDGPVFNMITAHQALLKRAETCQGFEGMESGIIIQGEDGKVIEREGDFALSDENVVGGWARVHRTGRKATYKRLAIAQRRPNYPTPFWEGAKACEQIVKCAEADALRSTFPTLLGGLYTESETILDVSSTRTNGHTPDVSRLVAVTNDAAPGQFAAGTSEPEPEQPPQAAKQTAIAELNAWLVEQKCDFNTFQEMLDKTGIVADAMSLPDLNALGEENAKRLLRAKKGMLDQLKSD